LFPGIENLVEIVVAGEEGNDTIRDGAAKGSESSAKINNLRDELTFYLY
jgi:hypothetical protein